MSDPVQLHMCTRPPCVRCGACVCGSAVLLDLGGPYARACDPCAHYLISLGYHEAVTARHSGRAPP